MRELISVPAALVTILTFLSCAKVQYMGDDEASQGDVESVLATQPKTEDQAKETTIEPEEPKEPQSAKTPQDSPTDESSDRLFPNCGTNDGPIVADIYEVPEGSESLPDFSSLTPVTRVCLQDINIPARNFSEGFPGKEQLVEWFAIRAYAQLDAPVDGDYEISINSDDGAKVYLDDSLVIDNDGLHEPITKVEQVFLEAGSHELIIEYYQGPRLEIALQLGWTLPGEEINQWIAPKFFKPPTVTP
ncbi:PA14 domain-containing protein [Pseudobacteriovorax antillogorgiicola]|uniref:PA14 domain-containing protein n=2 Tax=Pseudobacteriovorax antillogorgiicola TaxID=1513793 RepID=A0A1Y6BPP3_9BACT|nr:PA14 domain-containing protein [Pseudobacteriovorax antillogorgiicola]TCS53739.1 PA14 domain-containing protein [Pseudobacteriovorax antillogorgiicola]SMF22678.1 PA14 domain-containing protein [Pseudobacteriovorax antillogorgiicola]